VDEDAMGRSESRLMACTWNNVLDQLIACLKGGEICDRISESGNTALSYIDIKSSTVSTQSLIDMISCIWILYLFGHDPHFVAEDCYPIYRRALNAGNWTVYQFCVDMGWTTPLTRIQVMKRCLQDTWHDIYGSSKQDGAAINEIEVLSKLEAFRESNKIEPTQFVRIPFYPPSETDSVETIENWQLKILHNELLRHDKKMEHYGDYLFSAQHAGIVNESEKKILNMLKTPLDKHVMERNITVRRRNFVVSIKNFGA